MSGTGEQFRLARLFGGAVNVTLYEEVYQRYCQFNMRWNLYFSGISVQQTRSNRMNISSPHPFLNHMEEYYGYST
jgi:hypothetical protein